MILAKLQKTYPFLAYLSSTRLYIELHSCRSYETELQFQRFLIFLTEWLERIAVDGIYLCEDLQNINTFLKSLPQTYQVREEIIFLKCNKFQSEIYVSGTKNIGIVTKVFC